MQKQKKLLLLVSRDTFFLSHRKEIALAAQKQGWDVTVATCYTGSQDKIHQLGLKSINIPMSIAGKNLLEEIQTYRFLKKLYKKEKPDIVHNVGIKLILWSALAAKQTKVPCIINAIAGTGSMFSPAHRKSLVSRLIKIGLRLGYTPNTHFIVQNNDDKKLFIDNKIMKPEQAVFIKGSGVDLTRFSYRSEDTIQSDKIQFVFSGRMLEEKGVMIVVKAAKQLKAKYGNTINFIFCGSLHENPYALTKEQIESQMDGEYIKWLGFCPHIEDQLHQSHVFVYPSYYMEGLPKCVLDAEACGLPIITTDWVGCRDSIENTYNGFLIPDHDVQALVKKIEFFIQNPEKRQQMGKNSRELAERIFDVKRVVQQHIDLYDTMYTKFVLGESK